MKSLNELFRIKKVVSQSLSIEKNATAIITAIARATFTPTN